MSENIYVPPSFANQTMWKHILVSWLDLVKRYENREFQDEDQDFCYWYNERPLTGILGAAAWVLKDGWSLEEFSAKRRIEGEKKKGRPDLRVGLGREEAAVEAKIWWVGGEFAVAKRNIEKMLEQASTQLEGLAHWKCQRVSVCFVVPCRKETSDLQRGVGVMEELKKWAESQRMATVKHISKKVGCTRPNKRNYPGVLLVAKQLPNVTAK